jgi:hypothetical protein
MRIINVQSGEEIMIRIHFKGAWLGLIVLLAVVLPACTPAPEQLSNQEIQTAWGEAIYRWECARCHEEDRVAPLFAERLVPHRDAASLFEFNRQFMPLDKPMALPDYDYWAVTAYLLADFGMLDLQDDTELGPENAGEVIFLP